MFYAFQPLLCINYAGIINSSLIATTTTPGTNIFNDKNELIIYIDFKELPYIIAHVHMYLHNKYLLALVIESPG